MNNRKWAVHKIKCKNCKVKYVLTRPLSLNEEICPYCGNKILLKPTIKK